MIHKIFVPMKKLMQLSLVAIFAMSLSSCSYNAMVSKEEAVVSQWANVEGAYQRRADLIPNLVATVKGAAEFEQSTLTAVVEARAKATSVTVDPKNLTPESLQQFQEAQGQLGSAISRLLVSVEAYPQLRATQNFSELQAQLEGTENRINVERRKFNETVQDYNAYIRKFPQVIYAGWFGFEKKGYFEADAGAEKAPKVEF